MLPAQSIGVPRRITLRTKKVGAHVVVDARDGPTLAGKSGDYFAADEAAGPGH
jgi:hypothetical protein